MAEITVIQVDERPLSKAELELLFRGLSKKLRIPWGYFRDFLYLDNKLAATKAKQVIPEVPLLLLRRLADYENIIFVVAAIQPLDVTGGSCENESEKSGGCPCRSTRKVGGYPSRFEIVPVVGGADPGLLPQVSEAIKSISESIATKPPTYKSTAELAGIKKKEAPGLPVALAQPQWVIYGEDEATYVSSSPRERRRMIYCASAEDSINVLHLLEDPQFQALRIYIDTLEPRSPLAYLRSGCFGDTHIWNALHLGQRGAGGKPKSGQKPTPKPSEAIPIRHEIEPLPTGLARDLVYRTQPIPFFIEFLLPHLNLWPKFEPMTGISPTPETKRDIPGYIEKKYWDLLKKEEPLFGLVFSDEFVMSAWLDIASLRLTAWLERLLNNMKDSGEWANFKQERFYASVERETMRKIIAHNFKELWYRWIYKRKFHKDIDGQLPAGVRRIPQVEVSLKALIPASEWKLVELEYKKEQEFYRSQNVPWTKTLRQLRKSGWHDPTAWAELQSYLPKDADKIDNDWIRSSDGHPIICPHMRDLTIANLKRDPDSAAKAAQEVINKYKGLSPLYDNYYCRICGEVLLAESPLEGVISRDEMALISTQEEPLREFIWKQASHVIRAFVAFKDIKSPQYINQFTSAVAESLHEFISVMEQRLRKSKTATRDVINNKLKLFTSLYVFVTLMRIIENNPDAVRFTFMDSGKAGFDKMLKMTFPRFMSYNDTIINKLTDVSEEFLKDAFRKAYQNVQKVTATIQETPPAEVAIETEYTYQYARRMQLILYLVSKRGGKAKREANVKAKTPGQVEKPSEAELKQEADVKKELVSKLGSQPKTVGPAGRLAIQKALKLPFQKPDLRQVAQAKGFFRYMLESYMAFDRYVESKIYLRNYYDVSIIRENDAFNIAVTVTAPYQEFARFAETMRKLERDHLMIMEAANLRCYNLLFSKSLPELSADPTAIAFLYGGKSLSDVHKHKWKKRLYVPYALYRGSSHANTVEESRMPKDHFLADVLCDVCGASMANVRKEFPDIATKLRDYLAMEAFFNYYTYRCPKPPTDSPFHVFKSEKCEGCGIPSSREQDLAYYNKYRKDFEAAQAAAPRITATHKFTNPESIPAINTSWKFNRNIGAEFISATSEMFESKKYQNFIRELGYSEFAVYEDILSGVARPHTEATQQMKDSRANWLQNYVYTVASLWSIIINYRNFSVLDPAIKSITDELTPATAMALSKLPSITAIYKAMPEPFPQAVQRMRLNSEFDDFVYQYLLQMLLEIRKHLKPLGKSGDAIFVFIMNTLMDAEESHSQIKEQKAVSIEAAQKADPFNDPNMQDHSISREFDDMVGPDSRDKYKYDIDYDGHNETINE